MNQLLEVQIGDLLRQKGYKLAVAESCTGGLIGHRITNIPGASEYYLGSVTAYAYEAKERLLGVQHATLLEHGAVSRETVIEMARGVRLALGGPEFFDHTVGLSVSGIAGPGGGMPGKPVGLVWIGVSTPDGDSAHQFFEHGDRVENKEASSDNALELMIIALGGTPLPSSVEPAQVTFSSLPLPKTFTWQGQTYQVENYGRRWLDAHAEYILVQSHGKTFELSFNSRDQAWQVRLINRALAG